MAITIVLSRNLVLVATNTATSAGGPDTCTRIRGDTQARQPCGRRRGGSPIADPRRARVRSGPRLRRRSSSTMLTGIAFVVAPSIRGRRARRIRGRIYGHEYLGGLETLDFGDIPVLVSHSPGTRR